MTRQRTGSGYTRQGRNVKPRRQLGHDAPGPEARGLAARGLDARDVAAAGSLARQDLLHVVELDRLGHVMVEAGFARAPPVLRLAPAGERDQEHVGSALLRP